MPTCPSNHESQTNDFCSVCGIEMTGPASTPATANISSRVAGESCPICRTSRSGDGGDFCEECGYNFKSATPAVVPAVPAPESEKVELKSEAPAEMTPPAESQPATPEPTFPPTADSPLPPTTELQSTEAKPAWAVLVSVDPAVRGKAAEGAPVGQPERLYPLDGDKTIGRKSKSRNVMPDIDLANDSAVSHRQAKLALQSNGDLALIDLDSANGTFLNKMKIVPNVLHLLKDGDVIAMGEWTKLVIRKTSK